MSAWAERRAAPPAVHPARARERLAPLWVRSLTFFAVTALSALAYGRLLHHAPAGAAVAAAAAATACGGVLSLGLEAVGGAPRAETPRLRTRAARAAVTVAATLLGLELGLLAVGVPAHLVPPWHWGALASAVSGGLAQLGSWKWPYLGAAHWARLSVLMLLVPTTTLMALLFFWPAGAGGAARRLCALAVAVALALCGMANTPSGGWRAQGLLLVALVVAWLWLPTLRRVDAGRALAWTLACVVVALIVAPLLNGSHAWISFASGDATNPTVFQWDQLYGPLDRPGSRDPMLLTARANEPPGLLRVTSLDRFDGLRFIRSQAPPQTAATDIPAGAPSSWYETATITNAGLRSNLLVGASGITTRVTWHAHRAAAPGRTPDGTLSLGAPLASGTSYTVVSYAPKPTPAQMRAAPSTFPRSYLPYTEFELPLPSASALHAQQLAQEASAPPVRAQLVRAPALGAGEAAAAGGASALGGASGPGDASPLARRILASPYGPMYALARRLAAGTGSGYEVVTRIERYLLAGYAYDERPPLARYPLEAFLFEDRRGYCEQFSGAMSLMLRMDGIPSRVGVGFVPAPAHVTTPTSASSVWTATAIQAHAWVEVFFSGIGWVSFDPTPAASTAGTGGGGAPDGLLPVLPRGAGAHASRTSSSQLPSFLAETLAVTRPHAGGGSSQRRSAWRWALLVLVVLVAASSLGAWVRARSARARPRAAGAARPQTAVRELERALHGFAWPLLPGTTLTQIAHRLERGAQPEAAAYVRRLRDRRFGHPQALTALELSAARAERLALRRALARGRGLRGRLRALRLLPPRAPSL
ncbi:MAG TPA: transglutaminase-like domain-containing protein [Solirubrobacteraceae bacterium]|nr:transglutaminase-like domain-containing protein [Solirubrobacteraceae bacterium]